MSIANSKSLVSVSFSLFSPKEKKITWRLDIASGKYVKYVAISSLIALQPMSLVKVIWFKRIFWINAFAKPMLLLLCVNNFPYYSLCLSDTFKEVTIGQNSEHMTRSYF